VRGAGRGARGGAARWPLSGPVRRHPAGHLLQTVTVLLPPGPVSRRHVVVPVPHPGGAVDEFPHDVGVARGVAADGS
ncbi:hypothetical protein, partial [Streptomyces sp. PU-14G]|uniref:hypothetical protein n=1 Tax=Streptomyces sp. PU-14G TaxID=2800808 RepID=UPI0034DF06D8